MGYTSSTRKVLFKSKKRRCISRDNSNESNDLNTPKSDNGIGTSNHLHINVQKDSPFNTLITLQKLTDTESSVSINDEIMDQNNISEDISSNKIYHK